MNRLGNFNILEDVILGVRGEDQINSMDKLRKVALRLFRGTVLRRYTLKTERRLQE